MGRKLITSEPNFTMYMLLIQKRQLKRSNTMGKKFLDRIEKDKELRREVRKWCREREKYYGGPPHIEQVFPKVDLPNEASRLPLDERLDWILENRRDELKRIFLTHTRQLTRFKGGAGLSSDPAFERDVHSYLLDFLRKAKKEKLLKKPVLVDVGAGSGASTIRLFLEANRLFRGAKFKASDVQKPRLTTLRPGDFVEHDILSGPLPFKEKADVIIFTNVEAYLNREGRKRALDHLARSSKIGALIVAGMGPDYWASRYVKTRKGLVPLRPHEDPFKKVREAKRRPT
jgi:hypothetical protein